MPEHSSNQHTDKTNDSTETDYHRFCIAPMMDWSDRHCRYFWRLLTKRSLLYTEMITTGALIYGDQDSHLAFHQDEHPIAAQLGGSDPADLSRAALICQQAGYDEVNLNVGCPSERVKSGAFGACLMNEPQTVADGVKAMRDTVQIPITVKCRIGVDENDSYQALCEFVSCIQEAGCHTVIVHARKAWLNGLSPKQNREVPPLKYSTVYQLKQDFPALQIIINGGLKTISQCEQALEQVDGVMIGREAYQNPFMLNSVDQRLFGDHPKAADLPSAKQIALSYADYIETQLAQGVRLNHMTRHLLGLFHGVSGARAFRRYISENAHAKNAGVEVFLAALEKIVVPGKAPNKAENKAL